MRVGRAWWPAMANLSRASGCATLGAAARIYMRMAAETCAIVAHRRWTLAAANLAGSSRCCAAPPRKAALQVAGQESYVAPLAGATSAMRRTRCGGRAAKRGTQHGGGGHRSAMLRRCRDG
ncbi:Intracell protease PfpI family [Dorcoceras hygrometricum]|uniref:Intracell protease PfpI family n=1 Tax=Dorcoceras hygrometricum TaxID=472368 RepID=A0A2Z6ZSV9_9LAMI|nr:Intracell protease PfpI family [Dorcoceras hygrometricum]